MITLVTRLFILPLFTLSSWNASAAIMSPDRVKHIYCIPLGGRPGFDRVRVLVMDYIWDNFNLDPQALLMGWSMGCGPHGGATFRVEDRMAEQLRPFLKRTGYEMQMHGLWYDRESLTTFENKEMFDAGNELLIKYAQRLIEPLEAESPGQIAMQLESEFLTWAQIPHGTKWGVATVTDILPHDYGLVPLESELRRLISAAKALSKFNTDDLDSHLERELRSLRPMHTGIQAARSKGIHLPYDLENKTEPWTLQDWETFKKLAPELEVAIGRVQERIARYQKASPAERDQEARLSVAEKYILGWVGIMEPSEELNPETMEFFAHGFLMGLGTIESDYNELDQPLLVESEIADILNRHLVSSHWIATYEPLGDQRRQLVEKLASYKRLIPYLNVLLAAKLGVDRSRPPSPLIQAEYKKIKATLSLAPSWWGGQTMQPRLHWGALYRPDGQLTTANVTQGLKFIDQWFSSYNLPTEDWTKIKGIPLDIQRSRLEEQRTLSLCEQSLDTSVIRRY